MPFDSAKIHFTLLKIFEIRFRIAHRRPLPYPIDSCFVLIRQRSLQHTQTHTHSLFSVLFYFSLFRSALTTEHRQHRHNTTTTITSEPKNWKRRRRRRGQHLSGENDLPDGCHHCCQLGLVAVFEEVAAVVRRSSIGGDTGIHP
mgnify:CR=1 FL=1